MPVRVAFCITELDPGGAEQALFEIVTRLAPANWEVRVYCLGPETELSRKLQERGIVTICFGVRHVYQVGVLFRLAQQLREFRPALIQTFLFHANILGRLAGWWAGVSVVLSGLRVAERGKRWHLWLDRWTNQLVTLNVCVSEGVKRFAVSHGGLREGKLRVIPNGVDAERFASATPVDLCRFGIPADAWTLVTVGRLSVQKGHDELLGAVAPLLIADSRMHLLIVGEGPERESLVWLADTLDVSGQVHFSGFQEDVAGILKSCQAFALPSRWEGMPNALLEALAAGLPCIATDVEGVRELLPDESGIVVAPGDGLALRLAVEQVRHQILGTAPMEAQDAVLKSHTWTSIATEYESLFTECLHSGSESNV